jgi:type II secretory pathway pseudopilin PulG
MPSDGDLVNGKATVHKPDHSQRTDGALKVGAPTRFRRGFSLLDVLVSLAVIMVLLGIMLPSLTHVREVARRVVCGSNLHQIHLGLVMYAGDERDRIPDSQFLKKTVRSNPAPQEMIALYTHVKEGHPSTRWDGIGKLYQGGYLPSRGIFYCPSHTGEHTRWRYAEAWSNIGSGSIAGNYHYRGQGANRSTVLSNIHPDSAALLADAMQTRSDWNHVIGTNVSRADGSVFWYQDGEGLIAESLPGDKNAPRAAAVIGGIWRMLDRGPK